MTAYYRVMLGKQSTYADECVTGGFLGADFHMDQDLSSSLPDDWREFNKQLFPVLLDKDPSRGRISAGLACGSLWTVCKGINEGDIILSPNGYGM
jgi:restriction system protein